MSSSATPNQRKHLNHRRERHPPHPTLVDEVRDNVESSRADTVPFSDPGSFIESVTTDDPEASRQPSVQREPPRAKGP